MDALPVTSLVRQNQKRKQKGNNDRKETAVHGKPIDWVFTVCFFLLGPAYLERVGVRSRRRRRCATAASGSAAGTARWCGTSPAVRPVHTQNHQSNSVKTRSRKINKKNSNCIATSHSEEGVALPVETDPEDHRPPHRFKVLRRGDGGSQQPTGREPGRETVPQTLTRTGRQVCRARWGVHCPAEPKTGGQAVPQTPRAESLVDRDY